MHTGINRFRNRRTATRTGFACSFGWYLNDLSTSFFRFVGEHLKKFAPPGIGYRFAGISAVSGFTCHRSNIEFFDADRFVAANVVVREFVQKVLTLVCNPLVGFSNKNAGAFSTLRTLLAACKFSLPTAKKGLRLFQKLRVVGSQRFGINTERTATNINSNYGGCDRKGSRLNFVARKRNKPLAGRDSANRYSLNIAFDGTGEMDLQSANLRKVQITPFEFPARLFQRERVVAVSAFEAGKSSLLSSFHTTEERLIRLIESFKNVLQALRADLGKFGECLLEFRELVLLIVGRKRFLALTVYHDSLFKGKIIQRPAAFQPVKAMGFRLVRELCAVLKRAPHFIFARNSSTARRTISATLRSSFLDSFFRAASCGSVIYS